MPRNHGNVLTIRLPRELVEYIQQIATREFETKSNVVRRLVRLGLEHAGLRAADNDKAAS